MAENIIQIAEGLNSEVTKLNSERNKLEGMLDIAKSNYESAVKAYEEKYGVKLTEKNLQSEYNDVYARTKGSVLDLQEKIEGIKRGDYKKEDNSVEFELEPEVEPIRAEVEKKPAKRGRKPKAEKVVEVEPEEISVSSDDEIAIEEGPIKLDLDADVEEIKANEKVEEKPVAKTTAKAGRKSLSAAELAAAAVAESANVVQNPVQLGDVVDEDEVDLSGMSFGEAPKSATPVKEEAPKKTKEEKIEIPAEPTDFGSFGDFSSMSFDSFDAGLETSTEEVKDVDDVVEDVVDEVPTTETKVEESTTGFGDFGGFGDFSDFGGFGTVEEPKSEVKEEVKPEVKEEVKEEVKPVETNDFGDFGGFGGFGDMSEISVEEPKKEEKKAEPLSPEDWGFGDTSSDFGKTLEEDTFNFADMSDFKFGE